jgi:hypothetical protein
MPIIFSYDLAGIVNADYNRIQSMFERFGWERIGGSCYRYPSLPRVPVHRGARQQPPREDWLNNVVPALMCFRAYVLKRGLRLTKHSMDIQTSTGSHGARIRTANRLQLETPGSAAFGERQLRTWMDAATDAIPY